MCAFFHFCVTSRQTANWVMMGIFLCPVERASGYTSDNISYYFVAVNAMFPPTTTVSDAVSFVRFV